MYNIVQRYKKHKETQTNKKKREREREREKHKWPYPNISRSTINNKSRIYLYKIITK